MLKYPDVRRDETFHEDYHGHKVHDPYRWLEDPDSEETKKFVEEQNNVTVPFLNEYSKKSALLNRLTEMWNYPKFTCPFKRGERFYYFMNTGLQNQNVLYVQDSLDGEPRVFFDQNALSEDGTVALHSYKFSENGKLFAYALSDAGSDWVTIRVKDVETDKDLSDVLHRVKFSCIAWTHDNLGFFYNRYAEDDGNRADGRDTGSNLNQKLYYHRLGAEQSEDVLCAEFPDEPKWMSGVELSDCGRYVLLSISEGCDPVNRLWYCDRNQLPDGIKGLLPWVKLVDNFDAEYDYTTNNGSLFAFKTNLKAPRCKVITIDFDHPEQENWKDLVPEHEKDVLDWAACVNQTQLILCYMHDVKNELFVHDVTTGERIAQFPLEIGSIMGYSGKKKDDVVFFLFTSFLTPGTIYTCDMKAAILEPKIFRQIEVRDFDNTQFETRQVFYTSKDGTRIPMFLTCSKTMAQNGENPVLLYGYGGFNISITPYFSVSWIVFMKHFGGIFAVANIRGGGEYGEDWHKAGSLGSKQNCFDDFHAAAEYLVSEKYSKPSKIAISGGSNGGLLVAACANQRPELFGSVVAHVGVMDMLRFHKFTIGHAWTTDFGCSDLEEQYHWQIKYSPVHNIPNKPYPATILFTGDHDDRVVPLHSFKFIAQLQHQLGAHPDQTNPLLIRIDTRSGHGAGKPTSKKIEEAADQLNFIVQTLHVDGVF